MMNDREEKTGRKSRSKILVAFVSVVLTLVVGVGDFPRFRYSQAAAAEEGSMQMSSGQEKGASKTETTSERKILYWRAPMNPTEIYDKPGKSAMGMDLVPVYEDEVAGGGDIAIDPVTQQNMGVRTAVVEKGLLSRTIRTYGHITYDETRLADINLRFSGWIETLQVDYTGASVEEGELLFSLYSPELISAGEEYIAALNNVRRLSSGGNSQTFLTSARRRLEYFDVPDSFIKNITDTGKIGRTITIRSPFRGVVIEKHAELGSHIQAGNTIYRIADLSRVWVEAHIYEYEIPWVAVGQTAVITLPSQPGKRYTGKVSFIYPYLQAKTRDVVVRVEVDNSDLDLKPDMYADVKIHIGSNEEGTIIPSEAVIRSGERNVVFVSRDDGKFSPRDITLGLSLDDRRIQVLTGLAPGETIVTSGQFMLDSESTLKEAVQKMLEAKKPNEEKAASEEEDFFSDFE